MNKEEKTLCYCINVFGTTPTFLLPVFKDENNSHYYAQKSKNNKIVSFEEINIEKYKLHSKLYNVDTYVKHKIGSDSVYSIDYNDGFIFGTREIIISFYRNNFNLFNENFASYMSDFIAENQDVIKNTNYALAERMNYKPITLNFYNPIIKNNYYLYDNYHALANTVNIILDIEHSMPKRLMSFEFPKFHNGHDFQSPKFYNNYNQDINFKRNINAQLFKELFNKPPIYNLWNDRIINGFVSFEDFCKKIGIDTSFPDSMFKNHSFWKNTQLSQDVNKKYNDGYDVYYLQIKKFFDKNSMIIAQDYYTGRNYIKFYASDISSYEFIEFSISLIEDEMKKICFVVEEQNISALLDDYFAKQIRFHDIKLIIPPHNKYQGVRNKQVWW